MGVTIDDVAARLRPPFVRALLDLDRLRQAGGGVRVYVAAHIRDLADADTYTVWYLADGAPADYGTSGAAPVALRDVPARAHALGVGERLAAVRSDLAGLREPREIVVACYRTPSGRRVLVDGNHRAAAALLPNPLSGVVVVLEVHGPSDPAILPDLRHHPS